MFSGEPPRETALALIPATVPLEFPDEAFHLSSTSLLAIENGPVDSGELAYTPNNAEGEVVEVEEMEQNSLSAFNREPGTPLTSANTGDGLNLSNNPSTR